MEMGNLIFIQVENRFLLGEVVESWSLPTSTHFVVRQAKPSATVFLVLDHLWSAPLGASDRQWLSSLIQLSQTFQVSTQ